MMFRVCATTITLWAIFVWLPAFISGHLTNRDLSPVRLVNGSGPWEGRLEVYHNGQYGTVCDDGFGQEEANVLCRMLGFNLTGTPAIAVNNYKFGSGSGIIWIDDLRCTGLETNISDCVFAEWGQTDCDHSEDVGVICPTTKIRLVSGRGPWEGRIEVYHGGFWGAICNDQWDIRDARVVCNMLGYDPDQSPGKIKITGRYFGISTLAFLDRVQCEGDELDISICNASAVTSCQQSQALVSCPLAGPIPHIQVRLVNGINPWEGTIEVFHENRWGGVCIFNLPDVVPMATVICRMLGYDTDSRKVNVKIASNDSTHSWLAFVECQGDEVDIYRCVIPGGWKWLTCSARYMATCPEPAPPNITAVRLVDGVFPWEGRVEVQSSGIWGTGCDIDWDESSAKVVCRMLDLGFKSVSADHSATYGEGRGPIFLKRYNCHGNETHLNSCKVMPLATTTNCNHSDDIGVKCINFNVMDTVTTVCGNTYWYVTVNMTLLKVIYPDSSADRISLGHVGECRGIMIGDGLVFRKSYGSCHTISSQGNSSQKHTNHLSYSIGKWNDTHIVDKTRWKIGQTCTQDLITLNPTADAHQSPFSLHYYKDADYIHAIRGNPIDVALVRHIYVKVTSHAAADVNMVLKNCSEVNYLGSGGRNILLLEGCEIDAGTVVTSADEREFRFDFTVTLHPVSNLIKVTCDVKFCPLTDRTIPCRHGCHNVINSTGGYNGTVST